MCGVPFHAARRYLAKLLEGGHKVAICEQVEAPGPVRASSGGRSSASSPPAPSWTRTCSTPRGRRGSSRWTPARARTGRRCSTCPPGTSGRCRAPRCRRCSRRWPRTSRARCCSRRTHRPAVRTAVRQSLGALPVTEREPTHFDATRAGAFLRTHFGVATLEGFGVDGAPRAVGAAGAALRYLKDTQRTEARHVHALRRVPLESTLVLDETTRTNLEVLRTLRDGSRRRLAARRRGPDRHRARRAPAGRVVARAAPRPGRHPRPAGRGRGARRPRPSGARPGRGCSARWRTWSGSSDGSPPGSARRGTSRASDGASRCCRIWPPRSRAAGPSCGGGSPRRCAASSRCAAELQRALVDTPPAALDEGGFIRPGYSEELDALVALATRRPEHAGASWSGASGGAPASRVAQDPLQPGLRLLPRGHPRQPAPRARRTTSAGRRWSAPSASSPPS